MTFGIESEAFVRWIFRFNLFESIYFYSKKISKKIISLLLISSNRKYPSRVKHYLYNNYDYNLNDNKIILHPIDFKKVKALNVGSINLAGSELEIHHNSIDWSKNWVDSEDEESLHRWNWSIEKLSTIPTNEKINLAAWVQGQQEDWVDKYQVDIIKKKTDNQERWESYTVGERISNSSIFYHLTLGGWPSVKLSNAIQRQVVYLIHHLEYFGDYTGNHVINNARAIYLAGVSFDCQKWKELALIIIELGVPIVVTDDGFLREGSSHYQFLFTRWLLEIYYFATIAEDEKMKEFLYPYLQILLKQCHFFLVYNENDEKWDIPLIGDISPDFKPKWLCNLPWSTLATDLVLPPSQENIDSQDCWNHLWSKVNLKGLDKRTKTVLYNHNSTLTYPESGWFRIVFGEFTLFYRLDINTVPNYVGHHHHDLYHFCLFQNGVPIFVDAGRKDYDQSKCSWGKFGLSPKAHNSVMIDGIGSLPENYGRYPKKYIDSQNRTEIRNSSDAVIIIIESSCFQRLSTSIKLIRKFILQSNRMIIEDQFIGKGKHNISSFFHFSSGIELKELDDQSWQIISDKVEGKFSIDLHDGSQVIHERGEDSYFGWTVPAYGKLEIASTLSVECRLKLPVTLKYSLSLS